MDGERPGAMDETATDERRYATADFDYDLPDGRIAQHPSERRDESRLLVVDRARDALDDRRFRDIIDMIPTGDALVLNETRVFPARLLGRKPTGAAAEILLLRPARGVPTGRPGHGGSTASDSGAAGSTAAGDAAPAATRDGGLDFEHWEALVRPGSKLKPGRVVDISDDLRVEIVDSTPAGGRIVRLATPLPVREALERHGRVPLPPYVEREPERADAERYQTVYARRDGSVAAPTAGLHFTPALLSALEAKGVRLVRVVLHVGVGTFRPVESEDPAQHEMHAEEYSVSSEAAEALNAVREAGGALWAVGTTVTRTLETVTDDAGVVHAGRGETDLFIRPPYAFRAVDRLITNFHLPRSTLLMLVAAFGGYERVMRAYAAAVRGGYRFYSYGDAMVIV